MKKGISEKELNFISKLELKGKYFFTREEIKNNFTSTNEMNVYIHRLKKKGRIIKLNKSKYFLIPIKAINQHWSEHPFVLIDEIMEGKDYCIVGRAAAYYWKIRDQIPFEYEIYNTKRQEIFKIFNVRLSFKKRRIKNIPKGVSREIYNHRFIILTKDEAKNGHNT